jgi:hypothetical protein
LRNQKLRDAALLLPVIGIFLMLPAVLRLVSGGRWFAELPSLPAFLYLVWLLLIVAAAVLARMLLTAEAHTETAGSSVLATEEADR